MSNNKPGKPSRLKRILGWAWKAMKSYFMGIGVLVTLLYFLFILSIGSGYKAPTVDLPSGDFWLKYQLKGEVSDSLITQKDMFWQQIMGGPKSYYIDSILVSLRRASIDKRVKGIYLDFSLTKISLNQALRVHQAIGRFKTANPNTPIYFYCNNLDNANLLASSHATRVAVPPVSTILMPGPTLELTYFGDMAKKLGVGFTVFKTGPHKAVFEPYIKSSPSTEVKAEYQKIENDIRNMMIEEISKARGVEMVTVQDWLAKSLFSLAEAKTRKIVTDVIYPHEFENQLASEISLEADEEMVSYGDYLNGSSSVEESKKSETDDEIAYIEAIGTIYGDTADSSKEGEEIRPVPLIEKIIWAKDTESIKAVVMRISSPGGSAQASELIWKHLKELAAKKPLIVSMGRVAASGGYYLAAPAKTILAEPTTITGSIGVTALIPDAQKLQEKIGVYFHSITGSERKDLLSLGKAPNISDIEALDLSIQETYGTFLTRVSEGRGMAMSDVKEIAGGRVYTGSAALKIGLVDAIGDTQDAFRLAKIEAKLDPEKLYTVARFKGKSMSLIECVKSGKLGKCLGISAKSPFAVWPSEVSRFVEIAKLVSHDGKHPIHLSYLPRFRLK